MNFMKLLQNITICWQCLFPLNILLTIQTKVNICSFTILFPHCCLTPGYCKETEDPHVQRIQNDKDNPDSDNGYRQVLLSYILLQGAAQ